MIRFGFTNNLFKKIATGFLAVLIIGVYISFPELLLADSLKGALLSYSLPLIMLVALCCMVFVVKSAHIVIRILLKAITTVLCFLLLFLCVELLTNSNPDLMLLHNPKAFFLGLAVLFILGMISFAITGSNPAALRVVVVLTAAYSYISYFVLLFRGTALIPQDIFSLNTAIQVLPNYTFVFEPILGQSLLCFIGICLIASKLKVPVVLVRRRWKTRMAAAALSFALLFETVTLAFVQANGFDPHYWNQTVSIAENGSIVNFVSNIPYIKTAAPQDYSIDAVKEITSQYSSDFISSAQEKPDVVLILGESWTDFTFNTSVQTTAPVMPYLSSFRNRSDGVYGNFLVSSVGGGTSRTEFEVLMGASGAYGLHPAPLQFDLKGETPSLVSSFKQLGYTTSALHTGEHTAWGRDKAYPLLGFDQYFTKNDLKKVDSKYVRFALSDDDLYKSTLSILNNSTEPQFIYALTLQTHGAYTDMEYASTVNIEKPVGAFPETEQYMSLLNESDKAFGEFISALQERERPTLVVAFGDHLPALEEQFLESGVSNKHQLWNSMTFYVMWSNFELNGGEPFPEYLSANYLGAYMLKSIGAPLTGYQKFLLDGAAKMPVTAGQGFIKANGINVPIDEAQSTNIFHQQAIVQYNMIHDLKHRVNDFFYLQ